MQRIITGLGAALMAVVLIGGCANSNWNRADTGSVVGGVAGGALGSQIGSGTGNTIATVVGTLAGAALGNRIGQRMDQRDRQHLGTALEKDRTGRTSQWTNPDTHKQYSVTPTRTYKQGNRPCRKFTMNTRINGRPKKVHGTACRQPNGTWQIVNG